MDTQIKSLIENKRSGRTEQLRAEVLAYIEANPGVSRRQIAEGLKMPKLLNSISARVSELLDDGLIIQKGQAHDQYTNKTVSLLWPAHEINNLNDIPNRKRLSRKELLNEIDLLKSQNQLLITFLKYIALQDQQFQQLINEFKQVNKK